VTYSPADPAGEEGRRAAIAALSRELGRPDRDWALLAEGNASVALADGRMLVKASGVAMATASAEDFVSLGIRETLHLVDSAGGGDEEVSALFDAAEVAGMRPSVEALLHAVCLDLPGVTAVGHTHPIPVNALLCSARASALTDGSLFPDQIVVLGVDQLLVPYVDPGLRLAQVVRTLLREHVEATGIGPKVIYLRNHGMFALGHSDEEVLQITEMAVKVARVAAGGPVYLEPEQVARIDTRPDEVARRAALRTVAALREGARA
jgi:rhamnose utilization protein RhaD (predicted bifunctional aldolase and dehydrogenase)